MDVLNDNIKVENTHPHNQNGVTLGENGSSAIDVKLDMSVESSSQVHAQDVQQTVSIENPKYDIQNTVIFSQPQQFDSQKIIAMAEQGYIMAHTPNTTGPVRLPTSATQFAEVRLPRGMFAVNSSEAFHLPANAQSFVTSSGYTIGYTVNAVDYDGKVSLASQSVTSNPYYQNSDFTITPLQSQQEADSSREKDDKSAETVARLDDDGKDSSTSLTTKIKIQEEDNDSSDEDDVHVCGRCKQVFHSLNDYVAHKQSKVCKSGRATKVISSTSPNTSVNNQSVDATAKSEILVDNLLDTATKTVMSLDEQSVLETPSKNALSLDNQSMLESTVKSVMSISNPALMETPTHDSIQNSLQNQNILETAAKNTIFRDSFIPLEEPSVRDDITSPHLVDEDGDRKDKALVLLKMVNEDGGGEVIKRRRGRPPKSSYGVTSSSTTAADGEVNEDSPPKAKRKSRPPRRHKPDEDLSEVPINMTMEEETFSVPFQTLETGTGEGGVPTVENIQKLFSTSAPRGRGRGKRRGPHPLHRCPICQLLFPSRLTMMEHKRKHSKHFRCKICNEGFYTEDKLEKHLSKETHNYPCDSCERILISKQALMRHKLSHSDKLYKCEMCARAFKTSRDLRNHAIGMHSETRDYVCQVCNKGFSRAEKLKRHLMIHAPDRPVFTCPFKNHVGCDKTFYRKDKLTRHLYSHSKVKPFKCDQCDKSFARTDNLREHIRSHTGVFRYYCTVCGKGQPGPKKFLQHMLKQHNVENAEIPKPFDELAPEPLVQQHKAVVQAETAAKIARAASNMKKEREKTGNKLRKDDLEGTELHVDASHHVTLAAMNNLGIHAVNASNLLASPASQTSSSEQQTIVQSRANIEGLYTINQHSATSPQFQISRHVPEGMVRHISETILRENITRGETREGLTSQQTLVRHLTDENIARHHIVDATQLTTEALRRQISEAAVAQPVRETDQTQQQQQQQQTLPQGMTVEAEGTIPVSTRGLQLLPHGVLPGNLQFTTLLNSDLVAIGEAVIRNQNGIPTMFQQKFGPTS